jgi:glycosyltransferase involved in cell wall biosynthesis
MSKVRGIQLPSITINIAVFNEENRLARCLDSVFRQGYPSDCLEVIVVDGMSTDRTVEIAKRYPVRILVNEKRDPASGRLLGLLEATGSLHLYLDADMELGCQDWFRKMIKPLTENPSVIGSFTRFLPDPKDPPLNRFLSHNPFQLDPLLEHISTRLDSTIVKKFQAYDLCVFTPDRTPIVGVVLFRTGLLKRLLASIKSRWPEWMWSDVDFPIAAAHEGHCEFAYVRDAGIYHRSYLNVPLLLRKKRRDIYWSYLNTYRRRYATYINFRSQKDVLRLGLWLVYSNSLFFPLLNGMVKSVRHRDPWCMVYLPLLTLLVTDYVAILIFLDPRGRKLVRTLLTGWLGKRGCK